MATDGSEGLHPRAAEPHSRKKTDTINGVDVSRKIDLFGMGVLNSISAHIAVIDTGGTVIAVNDAWTKFAEENNGSAGAVCTGANYFEACLRAVAHDDLKEALDANDGIRSVLSGKLDEFELEYACHSPHEKRWFLMRVTPLQFMGPKAVVSHINITDKKLALERLVEHEKELSALNIISRAWSASISLESAIHAVLEQIITLVRPDVVLLFIKEGDNLILKGLGPEDHPYPLRVDNAHRVGHCLCGLAVSTEKPIYSINIHEDARCSWQECRQAGFTSFAAIPLKTRQEVIGTLGIASVKSRVFEKQSRFLESVANDAAIYLDNAMLYEKAKTYAHDLEIQLSERRKMEAMLRQTQKMEAIGKLAGGIAHDFNNILSPIIGFAELALGDLPRDTPMHHNLMEILKAGNRAKNLVRQILTFTRQSEEVQSPIDISRPVAEAIRLLRSSLPSSIEIVETIGPKLAPVLGDATQIHQIVMNLCTNAAHAMEERGGTLEVNLEQVYWDSKYIVNYKVLPKGPYIRLAVSDTGVGMAPDILESIFDPYFTTKEKGKGTGLGLAVVQGIVKGHHGEINVYSEPGNGTTFTIYLPVIDAEVESRSEDDSALPMGTESILFIDDEIAVAKLGQTLLRQLGYTVTAVTQSDAALRQFRAAPHQYDAVLTDMTMPKMRGDQLAKQVRGIRPDIPVVICTGFSKHISQKIAAELGIQAVLMKPFTKKELAVAIRKALDAAHRPA